ncbi:hypothetical protein A3G63_01950 [Candidatus Kaiserbacteria bacterium RIFCSPLOWO2_12_FULL_52_8]|uniref:Aspartyl/glutamyl-tRNA(Asn/Gln) amidotransferase subunit C n=1 Tax=Candidatus Kaiserbacteria bacterium RIFCSPHIGHO2_01_FULL_53_31 TaxID=1798481 RepID=A0A1F6CGE7_9BACT|nr:MAG: hypothetical protein A2678_00300 [Candidatus Kaiserbacteria bacterium RIFCSPHIGHO2_01_FULL_53_31]OGG94310.1 MAG: hypothetical protein A3G63_01950 [Candidatus Kaiserbacteria bacterium RIFCSPLOWO2_12_FULL_52_8]
MATAAEVAKLAALARISVSEEELPKFVKEFDAILEYVGKLETLKLPMGEDREAPLLRNVMRKDGEPHAPGIYTEKLAEQFPCFAKATQGKPATTQPSGDEEGVFLEVKQIITHD